MRLSEDVIKTLEGYSPPFIFNFRQENDVIEEVQEAETISGNILYYGKNKGEALEIASSYSNDLDWFVFVDENFNVFVLGKPHLELDIEDVFSKLCESFGFERREEQIRIAKIIYQAFESSKHAIIEAPTGTGKSIAYLIPAVLFSKKRLKRVVISTNTKNLQQQLIKKDIPSIKSLIDFKVSEAYGRNNYVCKRKAENALSKGNVFLFESDTYKLIKDFLLQTDTGLKSDFFSMEKGIDESVWQLIESNSKSCAHKQCPYYKGGCFFYRARKKLDHANIIVANHHLVLSHSVMENAEILPEFDVLVFDEAHNIERNATSYYTLTISTGELLSTLNLLYTQKKNKEYGLLAEYENGDLKGLILKTKVELQGAFERILRYMDRIKKEELVVNGSSSDDVLSFIKEMINNLEGVLTKLKLFVSQLDEDLGVDLRALVSSLNEYKAQLASFEEYLVDTGHIYWIKRFKNSIHFNITPINIKDPLKRFLFDKLDSVIFTSATLSVNGDFEFFKRSLGIDDAVEFIAKGNFDYKENSRLYLVNDMPMPHDGVFATKVSQVLIDIGEAVKGGNKGVLVLFTAYKMLKTVWEKSKDPLEKLGFYVYRQGEFDNYELLNRFKQGRGFLFATSSFWEGIDVRGEELSVVVVAKLPFDVPTGSVEAVRYKVLKEEGLNPFYEYSLPKAVIRLKQGLGRLIRQKSDRGVMVVLDSRIISKPYGKIFLNSLDYMKQERISLDEIKKRIVDFFTGVS